MRIDIKHQEIFSRFFYNITKTRLSLSVKGISTDTREISEGDLFIAIKGKNFDGNKFIKEASKLGASAALVSTISNGIKIQQIEVKNPVDILSQIATLWRQRFKIPVIAITGSNGKTSTKELLYHLLSDSYKVHATNKNFNTSLGLSLTLLELDEFHDISILELGSSKPGEIKALCEISDPTHGLITNIAPAHYMNFGSIQNILNEKIELFKYLKGGTCFLNVSDKELSKVYIKGKKVTFGIDVNCDFPGKTSLNNDGSFNLTIAKNITLKRLRNTSFIKNIISTSAVALTIGLKESMIRSKIDSFQTPKGRCRISKINGITIIDDTYNANLSSSLAALDYLNTFSDEGRRLFVFGDMLELGKKSIEQHELIGEKCLNLNLDYLFTIGKHSCHTFKSFNSINKKHFSNPNELIISLKRFIRKDDKILFKGSRGMSMENIINGVFLS